MYINRCTDWKTLSLLSVLCIYEQFNGDYMKFSQQVHWSDVIIRPIRSSWFGINFTTSHLLDVLMCIVAAFHALYKNSLMSGEHVYCVTVIAASFSLSHSQRIVTDSAVSVFHCEPVVVVWIARLYVYPSRLRVSCYCGLSKILQPTSKSYSIENSAY
jgi:hypothetical protein